jgi:LPXTG-site transpeptidase (sortase) family protein
VRLLIPKIKVEAPIIPVGVLPDGAMEAPSGPVDVGWYRGGPRPGEPGNALLTGHLDWHTVTGVFWRLRELKAGDPIEVRTQDGRTVSFAVESATTYPKDRAPVAEIFGYALGVVVTIITCDGTFIRNVRDYDHRLVVRARNR